MNVWNVKIMMIIALNAEEIDKFVNKEMHMELNAAAKKEPMKTTMKIALLVHLKVLVALKLMINSNVNQIMSYKINYVFVQMVILLMIRLKNAKNVMINVQNANTVQINALIVLLTEAIHHNVIVIQDYLKIKMTNLANNALGNAQDARIQLKIVTLALETEFLQLVTALQIHSNKQEALFVQIVLGNVKLANLTKINVLNAEETELMHQIVSALMEHMNQI